MENGSVFALIKLCYQDLREISLEQAPTLVVLAEKWTLDV